MASTTASTISANFPVPELTPLCPNATTAPTYATLQLAQTQLNANATSVPSSGGDGLHGHLALTITADAYEVISANHVPFLAPVQPPAQPAAHEAGVTAAQIADLNRVFDKDSATFRKYHDTDALLRNLLIAAVPAIFIRTLSDPVFGFANVTCLELLTHLRTTYGNITDLELEANKKKMNQASSGRGNF